MNEAAEQYALTPAQEKEFSTLFSYRAEAEYTQEDMDRAKEMFQTPEDFALLRKILCIHTSEERGLTMPDPKSMITLDPTARDAFMFDFAVDTATEEEIRKRLLTFYQLVRNEKRIDRKEELEQQNQEAFEKEQKEEKKAEAEAEAAAQFSDRL